LLGCFGSPNPLDSTSGFGALTLGVCAVPVLCLQEDVVTGAADGYARMTGAPAFRLLHVGSGFAWHRHARFAQEHNF
jgi:acetolactate synthase-1/2/3 large subunit